MHSSIIGRLHPTQHLANQSLTWPLSTPKEREMIQHGGFALLRAFRAVTTVVTCDGQQELLSAQAKTLGFNVGIVHRGVPRMIRGVVVSALKK